MTAEDGVAFRSGHIYVAPPDHHLLIKDGHLRVAHGPRENRHRPAIDVLFRSAAVACRSRVIGVVLTGLQDDGAAGLLMVKRCGGVAVVQSPADAAYPQMPLNALEQVSADHQVPLAEMGPLLSRLAGEAPAEAGPVPEDILVEARISERAMSDKTNDDTISQAEDMGTLVPFTCPECGGALWKLPGEEVRRYRCHLGHGFTAQALLAEQDVSIETALWAAVRAMEERAKVLTAMAGDDQERGRSRTARDMESRAHAARIRELLMRGG